MTIDWWTLGLQAVNAFVLLWILSHFLFRPVADMIAKRQEAATKELDAAHAARTEAEAALTDAKAQVDAVVAKRAGMLEQAQSEAERDRQKALDAARREADKLRTDARAEAARRKAAAEAGMRTEASELALNIAGRLLDRLPASARAAGFIDGLAEAVARLPQSTRDGIGTEGPVPVRAAVELSGDELEALNARLAQVLGRGVALSITVDPSLIAGLELDAPHAIVRNHFRADLDRVQEELFRDV
ncbi:F0F1 ATP synthase subunit delta [Psychromarinibacter sp. S121]|uniref:F0F1 ATP synthase subunit delta n=1 Tax=Psychromarinibacter sp. S121 TaxID=3415127 RepID=UPI003C7BC7CF